MKQVTFESSMILLPCHIERFLIAYLLIYNHIFVMPIVAKCESTVQCSLYILPLPMPNNRQSQQLSSASAHGADESC